MTQKIAKNSPSADHRTILSGHIFAIKARIDNLRKRVKQQYLVHMTHNMVNFGLLTAEICWRVWGTRLRVFATLLHGTLAVGVNQTLRR